jgi:hypothetical protein
LGKPTSGKGLYDLDCVGFLAFLATVDSVIARQVIALTAWAKAHERGLVTPSTPIGMQGEGRGIGTGMPLLAANCLDSAFVLCPRRRSLLLYQLTGFKVKFTIPKTARMTPMCNKDHGKFMLF